MIQCKQIRMRKGLTQAQVAEYLNISRASYTNIENGKRDPDTQTIQQLSDLFNVTVDELLGRQQPAPPDDLDDALVRMMMDLSPDEAQRVRDFVAGLKSARKG